MRIRDYKSFFELTYDFCLKHYSVLAISFASIKNDFIIRKFKLYTVIFLKLLYCAPSCFVFVASIYRRINMFILDDCIETFKVQYNFLSKRPQTQIKYSNNQLTLLLLGSYLSNSYTIVCGSFSFSYTHFLLLYIIIQKITISDKSKLKHKTAFQIWHILMCVQLRCKLQENNKEIQK